MTQESLMDLIWLVLLVLLASAVGGLLLACDRWLAPRNPTRH
jgi:uncharacterized membrane protein YhhN